MIAKTGTRIGWLGALLAFSAAHAEPWDMFVTNATGKPIKTISIAPSPASNWLVTTSEPQGTLNSGGRTIIHFDKPTGTCRMDLRPMFSDATTAIYTSINVCDNTAVTLKFSNGKPTYTAN